MNELEKIAKAIKAKLTSEFKHSKIAKVRVREDEDTSGDAILLVDVIFEGSPKDVDARELSSAVRLVRPALTSMGVTAFPLFSFISKSDAGAGKLEPA